MQHLEKYEIKLSYPKLHSESIYIRINDSITCAIITSEKSLLINVQAVREGYESYEIVKIVFTRSEYNLLECVKKIMLLKQPKETIRLGKHKHPVEQFIIQTSIIDSEISYLTCHLKSK